MSVKNFLIAASLLGFILLDLSSCVVRYQQLDRVPYGFHIDELSGSVDIGCLVTQGMDAHDLRYPLFSSLHYGTPKPPTFLYPAIVWGKCFGYSAPSLRALAVTVHLMGIAGLFWLAASLFGWRCALVVATAACVSPWTWNISRVAFESLFAVTFLIWGLFFIFKEDRWPSVLLSAMFMTAAAYSYPPFRLFIPLTLLTLLVFKTRQNPWKISSWIIFAVLAIFLSIPLIQKTISGELQQRFDDISIGSQGYLNSIHSPGHFADMARIFIQNYLLHLTPEFLFLKGDPSYVHSTRHFGILSWLDILGLGLGIIWLMALVVKRRDPENPWNKHKTFLLFLMANILLGIVPSALTNSELPNALRITGSWPFLCLLTGFFLWQACERWWGTWVLSLGVAVIFGCMFYHVYFKIFPQEGKGMFAYWALDQANTLKTDEDWLKFVMLYHDQDYHARYYLMQYKHMSCQDAENMWTNINKYLRDRGIY